MKTYAFAIFISMMPVLVLAAPGDNLADLYFSNQNPTLTPQEKAAIAIAQKWQAPLFLAALTLGSGLRNTDQPGCRQGPPVRARASC